MTTPNRNHGLIGADFDVPSTDAKFALGDCTKGEDGSEWVYVQADGAITGAGFVVLLDEDYQADMIDTTNSASALGQKVGVAAAAFADNEYGWVQIAGTAEVQGLASCAANAAVNSTATAGAVDDDASSGAEIIERMVLTTAVGGGGAANAEAVLSHPTVGATIA